MIWGKTTSEKLITIYSVNQWFVWRPVQLKNGRWIWWEYVWKHSWSSYFDSGYHYERYKI